MHLRWFRPSAEFWSSGLTVTLRFTPILHALTSLSLWLFPPRAPVHWPWVRHNHTPADFSRNDTCWRQTPRLWLFLPFHSAHRLQSAKKDMRLSSQREFWSPRCRRANPAALNSSDELFASPATSPSPSPFHSPCPSPRHSISQTPFRTKLQLVDLAGSECVGKKPSVINVLWVCWWEPWYLSADETSHNR